MSKFTILMYEDDQQYKDSFLFNLEPRVNVLEKELVIHHRLDGDTLESDLMVITPDVIMIDHDLGSMTGDQLIEILDNMPEFAHVILVYYSGGESIEDLRELAKRFKCHIQCFTKEGDDLEIAILNMVRQK